MNPVAHLIGVGVIAAEAAVGVSSHDSSFEEGFFSQPTIKLWVTIPKNCLSLTQSQKF